MVTTHRGGCHCDAVRFEVEAPRDIEATRCNCSIFRMTGFLHLIVGLDKCRQTRGREALSTYEFNSGLAKHYFCATCGVKSFYLPRSHPDGISVNVNCLDRATITSVAERAFDGANWEQNIAKLSPISD
jgi:hypothetical protein